MKRRDFIKAAAATAVSAGFVACGGRNVTPPAEQTPQEPETEPEIPEEEDRAPRAYKPIGERMYLSFEPYQLELAHTFTVASGSRTSTPGVQARIDFDGFVGYGEASMPPYLGHTTEEVMEFLRKVDLTQFRDPFQLEEIHEYIEGLAPGNEPAKAAVDIALHDLVGKLYGQPLWRIWGFDASKAPNTSFTIGIDTPEVVEQKTREALGRFKVLKVKVGLDSDKEMIDAIRNVTDVPLVVDANRGWKDKFDALEEIFWLADQGVQMVEQPMADLDANAWLRERSPIPIFADESVQHIGDIDSCVGAFDGINIKLMKCGGLHEAHRMLDYARAKGLKVMVGCMTETSCAVTAAAQLSPAVDFADLDGNLLITNDPFKGVGLNNGKLILPDAPGLGLTPLEYDQDPA